MFDTNGENCPVKYLKIYWSNSTAFFQRPQKVTDEDMSVWYCKQAVGLNAVGNSMSNICEKVGLTTRYLKLCIQAITVMRLRDGGVDPNDIVRKPFLRVWGLQLKDTTVTLDLVLFSWTRFVSHKHHLWRHSFL